MIISLIDDMWYVVWTLTGREKKAESTINTQCKDLYSRCFLPLKRISIKRNNEWRTIEKALFPGYLFIDTDSIDDFAVKLNKNGELFCKVLDCDNSYYPLNEEESGFVEKLYVDGGFFDPSVGIFEGDRIKITSGPLYGMEGAIKKIDRHKRTARIELNMFGRTVKSTVGLEIIEQLSQ